MDFDEIAQRYGEAFALYERGDFANARTIFSELSEQTNDRPSFLMANRCTELECQSPADWNGVYRLETK